jgi:glycosyltransferase involved in cell wall biosynthesis
MKQPKDLSICTLVTNIDAPTGGIQKNSRLLLARLNERGVRTFVCARNYYGLPRNEEVDGTVFHRSPVLWNSLALNGLLYLIDAFVWLIRNRKKYDVLHCQQMFGPTMVAAVASFLIRKPIVTRVTTIGELGEVKYIKQMAFSKIRLKLIRRVTRWVALTEEMKRELLTLGIPEERVRIIHNSTDIPEAKSFDPENKAILREKLGLGLNRIGVYVGRLSEEKNLDVLIDAWARVNEKFPDASLLLLGAGGDFRNVEDQLKDQVKRLGLEGTVRFLGHVANAKDYVLTSDVFVLPTRTEGMSNALVEALACGATIISTDIPANQEICSHEKNALLVPVGDVDALTDAILRVFGSSELSLRLGQTARSNAVAELSVERMVDRYVDLYSEVLEPSR